MRGYFQGDPFNMSKELTYKRKIERALLDYVMDNLNHADELETGTDGLSTVLWYRRNAEKALEIYRTVVGDLG